MKVLEAVGEVLKTVCDVGEALVTRDIPGEARRALDEQRRALVAKRERSEWGATVETEGRAK